MLRLLLILLFAANLAYAAWGQGWLVAVGWGPSPTNEPWRLEKQMRPEAVQLIAVAANPPPAADAAAARPMPKTEAAAAEEISNTDSNTPTNQANEAPTAPEKEAPAVTMAAAVEAEAAAAAQPAPPASTYHLPIEQLSALAQAAGLQWVQSDAEKIAAVQAAIAAEPQPVRIPRERPPVVVLDEGPLVLVETRRDLRDLALPFDAPAADATQA